MSFDPTGRYKGNNYDPNFAAKFKNSDGTPNKHHYKKKTFDERSDDGGGYKQSYQKHKQWKSPQQRGGDDGYESSWSNGYSRQQQQHTQRFDPGYTSWHGRESRNGDDGDKQRPRSQSYSSQYSSLSMDRYKMGNTQSFQRDNGYGNRHRESEGQQQNGNHYKSDRPTALSYIDNGDHALQVSTGEPKERNGTWPRVNGEEEPPTPLAARLQRNTSSSTLVQNGSHSSLDRTSSTPQITVNTAALSTPVRAQTEAIVATPATPGSIGELMTLDKLKRFKAQVEATRAKQAPSSANTVTRVAESFLLAQVGSFTPVDMDMDIVDSPDTMMPPPPVPRPAVTKENDNEAEEGEIADTSLPREQLLKAKLRQKLAQVKGNGTPGSVSSDGGSPTVRQANTPTPKQTEPAPSLKRKSDELSPHSRQATLPRVDAAGIIGESNGQQKQEKRPARGKSASPVRQVPPPRPISPPRTLPRSQASPPARRESELPLELRHSTERRPSERDAPQDLRSTPVAAETLSSTPAAPVLAVSNEFVIRQLQLLKAQVAELEKLITPSASPTSIPTITERQTSPVFETPSRPPRNVLNNVPDDTPKDRSFVHESRQKLVPKHTNKPYDRPSENDSPPKYDKYEKYNNYDKPSYKKPYNKYEGYNGFKGYSQSYDEGFEKKQYKSHNKVHQSYDEYGDSHRGSPSGGRGGYKHHNKRGGHSNYHADRESSYQDYKPKWKKHDDDGYSNASESGYRGGRGRGGRGGRGGYSHRGRGSYNRDSSDRVEY